MGAMAEAFAAYAQPLIDQTDGSMEQLQEAFSIGQLCYNLALLPADARDRAIGEMQESLGMDDEEFEEFRQSVIDPMLRRHEEMFPLLHRRGPINLAARFPSMPDEPSSARPGEKYPGTDRYAPCPCGSGEKYKFCCGARRR